MFSRSSVNYITLTLIVNLVFLCFYLLYRYLLLPKHPFVNIKTLIFPVLLPYTIGSLIVFLRTPDFYHLALISLFPWLIFFIKKDSVEIPLKSMRTALILVLIGSLSFSLYQMVMDLGHSSNLIKYENNINFQEILPATHGIYEGDYLIPYNTISRYWFGSKTVNDKLLNTYYVSDRTPLLSMSALPFLLTFGWNLFVFQITAGFLGNIYLIPSYLLLEKILGSKSSFYVCLLAALSHFLFLANIYTEVKMIALFFILLPFAYLFLSPLKKVNLVFPGLFFYLAYQTQQYTITYLFTFIVIFIVLTKPIRLSYKQIFTFLFILVAPVILSAILWSSFSSHLNQKNLIIKNLVFETDWVIAANNISNNKLPLKYSNVLLPVFWKNKYLNLINFFVFNPDKTPNKGNILDAHKTTIQGQVTYSMFFFGLLAILLYPLLKKNLTKQERLYAVSLLLMSFIPVVLAVLYSGPYIRVGLWVYALPTPIFLTAFFMIFLKTFTRLHKIAFFSALAESLLLIVTDYRIEALDRIKGSLAPDSTIGYPIIIAIISLTIVLAMLT